jgi:hypothetical protein
MNHNILCTMHVMWYESRMINETLDSIQLAIKNAKHDVDLIICLNSQTYIEKPSHGIIPSEMFNEFLLHPVLENCIIIKKTDNDPFYNIGDWAKDIYGDLYDYKYIVWGESDCLIPEDYFFLLQQINIDHPHTISLANRKMWDSTWDELEHPYIQSFPRTGPAEEPQRNTPEPYGVGHYITLQQLNDFNRQFEPELVQLSQPKVDGCMTAVSRNFPQGFMPEGLHIGGHDHYMELFMKKHNIPQYHIATRLKGHNCTHPNKRTGTSTPRGGDTYNKYKQQCDMLINKLIYE